MQTAIVRIAAHCLFDGWIIYQPTKRYVVGYANKSPTLMSQFLSDLKTVTGKLYSFRVRRTACEIEFSNKPLLFKIRNIIRLNKSLKEGFLKRALKNKELATIILRAFWDDEGTVGFYMRYGTRKLRARCLNNLLRKQLILLHKSIGVDATEDYDKMGVPICNKIGFRKFRKFINFTKGVKVLNGNGNGLVWKGYDKRLVLSHMINSYY